MKHAIFYNPGPADNFIPPPGVALWSLCWKEVAPFEIDNKAPSCPECLARRKAFEEAK